MGCTLMIEGSKVVVESTFVPDYNGLTGVVTRIRGDLFDPSMPYQLKVAADPTPENQALLENIGSPYIDLARPWEFWFVKQELKEL